MPTLTGRQLKSDFQKMSNISEASYQEQNSSMLFYLRITLAPVTAVPTTVNILYIIISFKILKNEFHHLLCLSLCLGDVVYGSSLIWLFLSIIVPTVQTNLWICLVTLSMTEFSLLLIYSVILVMCIERYMTVKSRNFGMRQKFNRVKYFVLGVIVAFALVIQLVNSSFSMLNKETLKRCSLSNLYGQYYLIHTLVLAGTLSIQMLLIIMFSVMSSFQIWQIFFKRLKIHPLKKQLSLTRTSLATNVDNVFGDRSGLSHRLVEGNEEGIKTDIITIGENTLDTDEDKSDEGEIEQIEIFIINSSQLPKGLNHKACEMNQDCKPSKVNIRPTVESWEIRAFKTNVILMTTTLFLVGPVVGSLWYELSTGIVFDGSPRLFIMILSIIDIIVNPIVHAWRIPEMRERFKTICKRN